MWKRVPELIIYREGKKKRKEKLQSEYLSLETGEQKIMQKG
jgi:hypothetical protein